MSPIFTLHSRSSGDTQGIPTYSVVEIPCRLQLMDLSFYRLVPYWRYREQFAALPRKKQLTAKQQATKLIDARFSGLPDGRMAYMHQSTYVAQNGAKRALLSNQNNKVLVLLHDFLIARYLSTNAVRRFLGMDLLYARACIANTF